MVKQKKVKKDYEKSRKDVIHVKVLSNENENENRKKDKEMKKSNWTKDNDKSEQIETAEIDKSRKGFREPKKPRPVELSDEPIIYTKEMFQHTQCKVGEQLPFTCDRCFITKKSRNKYSYIKNQKVICNGCYALLLGKGKEEIKRLEEVNAAN